MTASQRLAILYSGQNTFTVDLSDHSGHFSGSFFNCSKTFSSEVCGDNLVNRSTVSRWSVRFREDRLSIEDNPRSGRPSTTTDYTSEVIVNDILREDRRKTCEEIAHESRMSVASVYRIITDNLKMRKVAARWVRVAKESQKNYFLVIKQVERSS